MKVISKDKSIFFQALKEGEVFGSNGVYYMKTKRVRSDVSNDLLNAVNLTNGIMVNFGANHLVEKVDGHIEIY